MKVLYGLDIGNGDIKGVSTEHDEPIVFPSVVGKIEYYSPLAINSNDKISNMSVMRNGQEYAIGRMALSNSSIRNHDITDNKYLSEGTQILSETAISILTESPLCVGKVVIGLPIHRMNIAKEVARMFKGKRVGVNVGYFGEYNRKSSTVSIEDVIVIAQPHGTLFNLILDEEGEIKDRELARSGIAIFDIGYKTNDGVVFNNLDPVGRLTIHSKNGMHVAYEQIRKDINNNLGIEIQPYEVPEIIKTGRVSGENVRDIISNAFYSLSINILNEVNAKWEGAWAIENIVFTGGGSELLKPYITQVFDNAVFPEQCRTSNAEGFLKYAKRMWRDV